MKKKEKVYLFIKKNVTLKTIEDNIEKKCKIGIEAKDIEKELGIVRNNASTLLNMLNKENKLIKINGRPIRFIPSSVLKSLFPELTIKKEYENEEIFNIISSSSKTEKIEWEDPFKTLIGSEASLKTPIDQSKAAIMYPPNGLHTLILGPSGVGKTTFATKMHEYARIIKCKSKEEFPFVSLNCSDYYNNPQLLLSQLFGHIKGAFTGAETDKEGLVEKANGGILFLDEVHRLTSDGQEMLFYLMDNGKYYRLGEVENTRKSNILIIAATTEDPQKVLLKTFLRRIPVIITLPSISQKSISERINILEELLKEETIRINRKLFISSDVLKALAIYECKGNIGQLKSDIKFMCAKAFLKSFNNKEETRIEFDMLPKFIKNSVFDVKKIDSKTQIYLSSLNKDVVIYPSKEKKNTKSISKDSIYNIIDTRLKALREKGMNEDKINIEIEKEIERYFADMVNKFKHQDFNVTELYKVLDKEIIDFTLELITFASKKLNKTFNKKIIFGLAFHLSALIDRVNKKKPIINHELSKIRNIYRNEYKVASMLVKNIEDKFNIDIPIDENGFIAILLASEEISDISDNKIGILVVCHGDSTATSMADVCNRLLNSNFVKAIDMPLEKDVKETYQEVITFVKSIDRGKGVLLLVDMGSLKTFGEKITKETGIITRTIDKISTPLLLEIVRKVIYKDQSIEKICYSQTQDKEEKRKAIMTVCATGQGTSRMLKNIISDILKSIEKDVEIISINYMSADKNNENFKKIIKEYDILACVGNIKPKNDIPYFSMEEILNKKSRYKFYGFLESNIDEKPNYLLHTNENTEIKILEDFTLYINPKKAIHYINEFIKSLNFEEFVHDKLLISSLTIHLGFMIERVITKKNVIFENIEEFKRDNYEKYIKLKNSIELLEEAYKIKINDDEICYAIQVINGNKK